MNTRSVTKKRKHEVQINNECNKKLNVIINNNNTNNNNNNNDITASDAAKDYINKNYLELLENSRTNTEAIHKLYNL
jgi:hypothetical protein